MVSYGKTPMGIIRPKQSLNEILKNYPSIYGHNIWDSRLFPILLWGVAVCVNTWQAFADGNDGLQIASAAENK